MNEQHYRNLEHLFVAAPINQQLIKEAKLTVSHKQAFLVLQMRDEYYHAAMSLHGAIYFKLLNDAAYLAAASEETISFLYTKSYQIEFKRPVHGGVLFAKGLLINKGTHEWIARSETKNEQGKVVASGEGVFVKIKLFLKDQVGYSAV